MKESTQTLLFLGAAIVAVFGAWASRPEDATYQVDKLIGEPLFNPFEEEEAKRLRIVRVDEQATALDDFEVAEQDGVWSIPSEGGYPADAERQMAEAVTGVMDREILAIATQSAADHADYGVIEPSAEVGLGESGVGTRVTLTDSAGEKLVDLVIGKAVKDREGQHYVRRTTQDVVFVTEINPDDFSTRFEDWIEDDLLDLNPWDIERVRIRDYSAELVPQGFRTTLLIDPRTDLTVEYDEGEGEWRPVSFRRFDREIRDYEEFSLTDDQELNEETLRELKNAVGDLRIIDVERKPAGLSANLKAGADFLEDRDSARSLQRRGFAATQDGEVLSTEGEVLITLKDGVEYVLRFGKLRLTSGSGGAEEPAEGEEAEGDADDAGVSRYLFVMAQFNEEVVDPLELEELPESEEAEGETDEAAAEEAGDEANSEDADDASDAAADEEDEDEAAAIERRNRQLEDERNEKLAEARQRVDELNERFGDWYYVIAEDVYKRIAISQDDLIQTTESEESDEPSEDPTAGGVPGLPDIPGVGFDPSAGPGPDGVGVDAGDPLATEIEPTTEPSDAAETGAPADAAEGEQPEEADDATPAPEDAAQPPAGDRA